MAVQPALGRREAGWVLVEVGVVGEGGRFSAGWSHHQTDKQETIQCTHTYGNTTYTREGETRMRARVRDREEQGRR